MSSLLRNATPCRAEAFPFVDDSGCEGQLVVVKIQYRIGAEGQLQWLEVLEPMTHDDRYDDTAAAQGEEQDLTPLLRPADVMHPQPSSNVILTGHVYAPRGREDGVRHFEAWLGVGGRVFPMRVHGPRRWRKPWMITRLLTFFLRSRFKARQEGRVTQLALRWQHGYGGTERFRDRMPAQSWPMNPAGRGFHADPRGATVIGMALPEIEDPRQAIKHWRDQRVPQIPGAVNPCWAPRAAQGGTRDSVWRSTRAPAMPGDGTPLFHNTAHPALQFSPHLTGGEPFHAQGFTPDGKPLAFKLPPQQFSLHSYHYGEFRAQPVPLNTVLIEAQERRLTLLYRCFVPALHQGNELRRLALGSSDCPAQLQP